MSDKPKFGQTTLLQGISAGVAAALQKHDPKARQIPAEKWGKKIRGALVGVIFLALAVWSAKEHLSPWVTGSSAAAGAYVISPDMVRGAAKWLLGTLREVIGLKKDAQ